MINKNMFVAALLLSFAWSCKKGPTHGQLIGTWIEQNNVAAKSKIIFYEGDSAYFYHASVLDTLSYTLDSKHSTIFFTLIHRPTSAYGTCSINYYKKKKVLEIGGLFPAVNGKPSVTDYKQ